jgi:hypothetical protein
MDSFLTNFRTLFPKDADFYASLKQRASRLDLDTSKHYCMVRTDTKEPVYVGKFVRSYRMGSGDGMTAHWEFSKDGVVNRIDDEMWGSLSGAELVGFVAIDAPP